MALKKGKSGRIASAIKSKSKPKPKDKGSPANVDDYLARTPEPARSMLKQIRAAIRSTVPPEATEIISYKIPAFRHNGVLVWFAAFSDHCSIFPTAAVIATFKEELAGFTTAKGTIQFPTDKPVPTALIKKIVKERIRQNESKKRQ